jgi:phosphoribosyl 1,2-cyclic phosphodiesterase
MNAERPENGIAPAVSVCVLASGSRGNAIYISDGLTAILVDAGLSAREIDRRLRIRGLDAACLSAILVTHEHTDHVRGLERLVRRHRLPVYLTGGTHRAAGALQKLPELYTFTCGSEFRINSLSVRPFSIPHDARDPAGFAIGANGSRIGIATDLGQVTSLVRDHLRDCQMLVLEANHDPDMLITGPYPWFLKQRIRSRTGHLSNHESSRLLAEVMHTELKHVILAHLSETNNTPAKASAEALRVLAGTRTSLTVAAQSTCSPLITIR